LAGSFSYNSIPTNSPKGSSFEPIKTPIIPTGVIEMFAGSVAPIGWLICDGSIVSRIAFSDLFKIIGTTYGSGNSNNTFTLPDMRGRCPIGVGTGASLTARTLGSNVGAETAALSEGNLPSHTHTASVGTESVTHTHTGTSGGESTNHVHYFSHTAGTSGSYGLMDSGTASSSGQPSTGGIQQNHTHATTTGTESANHTHSVTNSNTGSGTAFGIMPPSIVVNFIIKI